MDRLSTAGRARAFGAPRARDPQRRARRQSAPRPAEGPTVDLGEKRRFDQSQRTFDVVCDERRFEPHDGIARALERGITPRVRAPHSAW